MISVSIEQKNINISNVVEPKHEARDEQEMPTMGPQ